VGWCCDHLMRHFERRHDRGLFVFAEPPDPAGQFPASFWLGMRAVRMADMERLTELREPADLPLTVQTWFPLWYCPWCGVGLESHYGRQLALLLDPAVSDEHRLRAEPGAAPDRGRM
jgi:hypothetical protein